jgi:hypothetical protein
VTWANPVDLRDVPLDALDDVVEITRGQVSVYDGASRATKPSRGVGLNAPAIVALDGIFPPGVGIGAEDDIEGSGSDVVTEDDRVDALVRRLKRARGTRFIAYDAKSGTWRFRVEHFTRYGLDVDASDDDDDDDDAVDDDASIKGGFKFNSQSKRTQSLRDWLVAHFDSPYPEERDKERMAAASGMTRAQVGNWFINARVRIWRPLVMQLGEEVRLLPIRPRSRGERRSLRTFPVVTLHPRFLFNA